MFNFFRRKPPAPPSSDKIALDMVWEYLDNSVTSFDMDPSDTDFQRGYEAAMREMQEWFKDTVK